MIERGSELAVKRQAELLGLSRSSVYYTPRPVSERDLVRMRRLDELHLELPFYRSRKLADQLRREGHEVGRRHVATLMRRMGIEALERRPRTSRRRGARRSTRTCSRVCRSSGPTRSGRATSVCRSKRRRR